MTRVGTTRFGALVVAAALVAAFAAVYAARASGRNHVRVVMTAANKTLGQKVLVNRRGMSLYSLSVERRGRFICTTSACLSLWKPLVVAKGMTPTGVAGLSTVKRPDRRLQVAYRGGPLYTFSLDKRRGDVKGNGFKDVGVWRVATVAKSAPTATTPAPGGGYGGGYGP